jgi:hypothetical protein
MDMTPKQVNDKMRRAAEESLAAAQMALYGEAIEIEEEVENDGRDDV